MSRVKRGVTKHARHKKVLELAAGHRGPRSILYKRAHESVLHALDYATRDRRDKKGQFRRLWIQRINAAARLNGLSYSQLIHGLQTAGVEINRKMLADLAVRDETAFATIAGQAKTALA